MTENEGQKGRKRRIGGKKTKDRKVIAAGYLWSDTDESPAHPGKGKDLMQEFTISKPGEVQKRHELVYVNDDCEKKVILFCCGKGNSYKIAKVKNLQRIDIYS